ncbi:MAG: CBS domain-containing protein [Candidatus Hodarchaeota archaeon]
MENSSKWPEIEVVPILERTQPLSKVIALLQEGNDIVIIVDEDSKFDGLIRTRDVVSKGKGGNPSALCKNYVDRNVPTLLENEVKNITPTAVGEMMKEGKTRFIPVLDRFSRVKGTFKDSSVLSSLVSNRTDLDKTTIKEAINWDLIYMGTNESIGNAIVKFREYGYSRIPVINSQNKCEGLIIDRSLLRTNIERRVTSGDFSGSRDKDWYQFPVVDLLSPVEFISPNSHLIEAVEKFLVSKIHTLLIKNNQGKYGILTALDIIYYLLAQKIITNFTVLVMEAPDEDIRRHANRKGLTIMEREQEWLGSNCTIKIRFKRNLSQSKRGQFSITSSVHLNSEKGHNYHTESTDFGAEKAVNKSLDKIARIISNDKKRTFDITKKSLSLRKISDLE